MLVWFIFSGLLAAAIVLLWGLDLCLKGQPLDLNQITSTTEPYLYALILSSATFGEYLDLHVLAWRENKEHRIQASHPSVNIHPLSFTFLIPLMFSLAYATSLIFADVRANHQTYTSENITVIAISLVPLSVSLSAVLKLSILSSGK